MFGLLTSVTTEFLYNFLRLEIPDVYLAIFGARHDPLATSHRKVGKYAILLVLVSSVRLQALTLRVVPKLEGVVKRRGKNVFAVGGEFDKRDRRVVVVVVNQC